MLTVLLVIQVILAVAMVTVILLQRSSSDGLAGLGGGAGGGGNSLMSGRASANLLTKTTSFLAVAFMANSMIMATVTARSSSVADTVIEKIQEEKAEPQEPSVPIAE